jgi:hypothetical protein
MTDVELLQYLRKYFNVYYKDINVIDGTLFVDIPNTCYQYLIDKRNDVVCVMNELENYFSEEGLQFFFQKMYKIYAYCTAYKSSEDGLNKERIKEVAHDRMQRILDQNEQYNKRQRLNAMRREMSDLKDHSIKTHCNIGNI